MLQQTKENTVHQHLAQNAHAPPPNGKIKGFAPETQPGPIIVPHAIHAEKCME
jgi:hypothetical protein